MLHVQAAEDKTDAKSIPMSDPNTSHSTENMEERLHLTIELYLLTMHLCHVIHWPFHVTPNSVPEATIAELSLVSGVKKDDPAISSQVRDNIYCSHLRQIVDNVTGALMLLLDQLSVPW